MTEIGEIPADWTTCKFAQIALTLKGTVPKNLPNIGEGLKIYPYLTADYLRGKTEKTKYFKIGNGNINKIVKKDEIVLIWDGSSAGEFFIGNEGILSSTMVKLVFISFDVIPKFIYYYMKGKEDVLKNTVKGSTIPHVSENSLFNLYILLPHKLEQHKIAEIIATADEAIQKVNEEITLTEKLKKGLMQILLTKGIGHTKFKMTAIGEMPAEWRTEKISKLGQIVTGGTPSTYEPAYWNGEIPWIASGDVHQRYIKMARKFITQEGYLKSNCNLLPIGTVLIALNGQGKTRGLSAILDIEAVCNQSMAGIIPKRDILNSVYLLYHLLNRYAEIRNISGIGRNGLNLEHIGNIVISCPPLIEQEKIAEIISTIDNKLLLLGHKKDRLERLKKGLMGDLLTGKVRVKINTSKGED